MRALWRAHQPAQTIVQVFDAEAGRNGYAFVA
jgi:hypothetical protein